MIHFTKYADQKFEILNKHGIYFTREQVEDAINLSDKSGRKRSGYLTAEKDGIKVIFKKERDIIKIFTFFPVK